MKNDVIQGNGGHIGSRRTCCSRWVCTWRSLIGSGDVDNGLVGEQAEGERQKIKSGKGPGAGTRILKKAIRVKVLFDKVATRRGGGGAWDRSKITDQ